MTCPPPKARSGRRGGAMTDVVIVDSGVANLASITSAFRRLGATVVVTGDEGVVRDAPRVVLPGVGAFGAGLGALRARQLDQAVTQAAARGTPLLGVCLGMQILCEASEEAPGVAGLGVIPGTCRRLPEDVRVPHLGWNAVTATGDGLVATGVAAFANSYALREAPAGWVPAWTTHGVRFVAALEKRRASPCLPVPSRAVGRVRRGAARALARRSEGRARSGPRRLDPGTVAAGRPLPRRTGWSGGEGSAVPASPGRGGPGVTGGAVRVSGRRRDRRAGCGGVGRRARHAARDGGPGARGDSNSPHRRRRGPARG